MFLILTVLLMSRGLSIDHWVYQKELMVTLTSCFGGIVGKKSYRSEFKKEWDERCWK